MTAPLMPKATASWLLDNTTLTFEQIAEFCGLHPLEVQSLADGETFVVGVDPIATEQLSLEEIELGTKNPAHKLRLKQEIPAKQRRTSGPRYTPLNKRQDKPDAVSWLLRHHGNLSDNQIIKLIGTTKSTIDKIRDRSHWNLKNLKPRNPVELGLCTERDLQEALISLEKKEIKEAQPKTPKAPKAPKAAKVKTQKKAAAKKEPKAKKAPAKKKAKKEPAKAKPKKAPAKAKAAKSKE
jgi:uncharacterized protein